MDDVGNGRATVVVLCAVAAVLLIFGVALYVCWIWRAAKTLGAPQPDLASVNVEDLALVNQVHLLCLVMDGPYNIIPTPSAPSIAVASTEYCGCEVQGFEPVSTPPPTPLSRTFPVVEISTS